jgi:hypothetical protein
MQKRKDRRIVYNVYKIGRKQERQNREREGTRPAKKRRAQIIELIQIS